MTCESHTSSLLIVNFVNFLSFHNFLALPRTKMKKKRLTTLTMWTGLHACYRASARVLWRNLRHKRKNNTGVEMKYGGLSELHSKVNMERTIYSNTTAGEKMAFKTFFNFQFMSSAFYGAWMKNVTCKAADKLLTGNHVKSSRQLVR